MMTREPVVPPESERAVKLTSALTVERTPVDLSDYAFCPIPSDYFKFALERGVRGQATQVLEVTSWNSGQGARFRVKT